LKNVVGRREQVESRWRAAGGQLESHVGDRVDPGESPSRIGLSGNRQSVL